MARLVLPECRGLAPLRLCGAVAPCARRGAAQARGRGHPPRLGAPHLCADPPQLRRRGGQGERQPAGRGDEGQRRRIRPRGAPAIRVSGDPRGHPQALLAPILVPYHGWRISHRTHHQNHGHVEKDESWHPLPEKLYNSLDFMTRKLRFTIPFPLFAFPLYLFVRSPGKSGTHFNPNSSLFQPNEKKDIITSTASWLAMVGVLAGLTCVIGPMQMLKLYAIPYLVFVAWLDMVTYLHHHGHEDKLPWYRGKEWSYLRGGLTTLDRDYGLINNVHHDIGTHVIHHLFPQIPHYHLVEATEAAKPVLGKYYKEPKKSGPLPFHLSGVLAQSLKQDHYVSDTGDVVYYQTDSKMNTSSKKR